MTGQVKAHQWQDVAQREAAVTELQAFCTASINRLRLEAFKPILLKGAVADWPAVNKWSLDWLAQHYGEQRFVISSSPGGVLVIGLVRAAQPAMSGVVCIICIEVLLQSAGASSPIDALHLC